MNNENSNYWQTLKSGFMKDLECQGIQSRYFKDFSRSIDLLIEYAEIHECIEYSPEIGYAFWVYEKTKNYKGLTTPDRRRKTIKRLNEYLYGDNFWQRTPRKHTEYRSFHRHPECPTQFTKILEQFLSGLNKENLKDITILSYRRTCTKILLDFDRQGVNCWSDIGTRNLLTAFLNSTNKTHFVAHARRFFRYLVENNVVDADYSSVLIRPAKRKPIPSVYSEAEIQQLLRCVETVTPQGKRDHAILLLAVRLGLRASDIANLCFKNVNFENSVIKFVQQKTSVPHQLSLTNEVAAALRDYINAGREKSDEPYVFLDGFSRPLTRRVVSGIASRNFKKTGIDFGHRHHGSHALRMTFASQLVAENVPYDAVRALLGQVDPHSTRHYVEFAVESLRTCALEVPLPSGRLKNYLTGGGDY